jgi:outer membrane protein
LKKTLILLVFSLGLFPVFAEQLSKIGVVNFTRIIEDYFSESSAWREIDNLRTNYQNGLNQIMAEIEQLRNQRLEAQRQDNQTQALQLDERINQRQEYMREYHNVWSTRINNRIQNISSSGSFTSEVYGSIRYIAESQGYSVILRTQDPDILWYSQAVDITDLVIERLKAQGGRR